MTTPDPTTPALLSAPRLDEIRERSRHGSLPHVAELLAHLAALTAPAVPDGGRLPDLEPHQKLEIDTHCTSFVWSDLSEENQERHTSAGLALHAIGYAAGRSEGEAERAAERARFEDDAAIERDDADAEIARLTAERDTLAAELAEARTRIEQGIVGVAIMKEAHAEALAAARRDGAREERARWQDICADLAANPEHERTAMIAVGRARLDEARRARGEGQGS